MSKEIGKHQFQIASKIITVYPSIAPNKPAIYLNNYAEDYDRTYESLREVSSIDFSLVTISGIAWDRDMSPWEAPPISKGDTPCTGGASKYLELLTQQIIPAAEEFVHGSVLWRGLAGYSLAGLFAIYSIYKTKLFSRIASMSGSLWFPGFKEYVFSNEMIADINHLYLSLGDKESKTRNSYLKTVQENTEEIKTFYINKGIDTAFQLNPGNHYDNAVSRTVTGIKWILER